ncbi:MAG: hypothetical protein JW704_03475, partial [Anaerolineaceae bacterium]|nr:hypothetical protein [Anaerolineaceae bacterium]
DVDGDSDTDTDTDVDGDSDTDTDTDVDGDGDSDTDTDTDDETNCIPNPCQNGGICNDVSDDYKCNCVGNYTGNICDALRFEGFSELSDAKSVSADGSVIVGSSEDQAAKWTSSGTTLLGVYPGDNSSYGIGVSGDGLVTVGVSSSSQKRTMRWTASTFKDLGTMEGGTYNYNCIPVGTNQDGSIVVGNCTTMMGYLPFYWTEENGMQESIGLLDNSTSCSATALSLDGKVVVGQCLVSGDKRAFRWSLAEGTVDIGLLDNAEDCYATGVNDNGKIIVGYCDSTSSERPFSWRLSTGFSELSTRTSRTTTRPTGVSSDGSVIIGYDRIAVSAPSEAIIWHSNVGVNSVASVITNQGGVMTGWELTSATACTPDGSIVVGTGVSPSDSSDAWMVRLEWE